MPSGLIIYVAILAHTASGDIVSNIEQFMGFAGTVTFPETGPVVMVVDDPGGIGNFTISGTRDAGGQIATITQIAYTGASESYIITVKNDRPDTITQDNITTRFVYQADGSITFETVPNHSVSALSTMASTAGAGGSSLCDQYVDKNAYEKALWDGRRALSCNQEVRTEAIRKLKDLHYPLLFIGLLDKEHAFDYVLPVMVMALAEIQWRLDYSCSAKINMVIGYFKLVFESMEGVIGEIIEEKLAEYDRQCPDYSLKVYIPEMHEDVYLGDLGCRIPLDATPLEGSSYKTYTLGNDQNYVGPYISWVTPSRDNRRMAACRDGMGTFIWLLEFNQNDDSKAIHYSQFINGKSVVNYWFYPQSGNLKWSFYFSENGNLEESYHYAEDGKLLQYCDPQGCTKF